MADVIQTENEYEQQDVQQDKVISRNGKDLVRFPNKRLGLLHSWFMRWFNKDSIKWKVFPHHPIPKDATTDSYVLQEDIFSSFAVLSLNKGVSNFKLFVMAGICFLVGACQIVLVFLINFRYKKVAAAKSNPNRNTNTGTSANLGETSWLYTKDRFSTLNISTQGQLALSVGSHFLFFIILATYFVPELYESIKEIILWAQLLLEKATFTSNSNLGTSFKRTFILLVLIFISVFELVVILRVANIGFLVIEHAANAEEIIYNLVAAMIVLEVRNKSLVIQHMVGIRTPDTFSFEVSYEAASQSTQLVSTAIGHAKVELWCFALSILACLKMFDEVAYYLDVPPFSLDDEFESKWLLTNLFSAILLSIVGFLLKRWKKPLNQKTIYLLKILLVIYNFSIPILLLEETWIEMLKEWSEALVFMICIDSTYDDLLLPLYLTIQVAYPDALQHIEYFVLVGICGMKCLMVDKHNRRRYFWWVATWIWFTEYFDTTLLKIKSTINA